MKRDVRQTHLHVAAVIQVEAASRLIFFRMLRRPDRRTTPNTREPALHAVRETHSSEKKICMLSVLSISHSSRYLGGLILRCVCV